MTQTDHIQIDPLPEYVTVERAAEIFGSSRRAFYELVRGLGVPVIKIGRIRAYETRELVEALDRCKDYDYAKGETT